MEKRCISEEKKIFSKNVTLAVKGIAVIIMLVHHLFSCFPDYVKKYDVSAAILTIDQVLVLSYCSKVCVAVLAKGIFYMLIDATGMSNFLGTPTYNEIW